MSVLKRVIRLQSVRLGGYPDLKPQLNIFCVWDSNDIDNFLIAIGQRERILGLIRDGKIPEDYFKK